MFDTCVPRRARSPGEGQPGHKLGLSYKISAQFIDLMACVHFASLVASLKCSLSEDLIPLKVKSCTTHLRSFYFRVEILNFKTCKNTHFLPTFDFNQYQKI